MTTPSTKLLSRPERRPQGYCRDVWCDSPIATRIAGGLLIATAIINVHNGDLL